MVKRITPITSIDAIAVDYIAAAASDCSWPIRDMSASDPKPPVVFLKGGPLTSGFRRGGA